MTAQTRPFAFCDALARMVSLGASDLFLRIDTPAVFRVDGRITRNDFPGPDRAAMQGVLDQILTPLARKRFEESPDLDVAHAVEGLGRFRINVFLQQGAVALVARLIPLGAIDFKSLNLPESVREMADEHRGLILLVGPTGCGKSTTMAALIHHINLTRSEHIVTIEDPIEFVHQEVNCLIHQRQVGFDTDSFATALRHVVRQSPDVILIGEMRDADTMQTALAAALTGHLVLSSLHTTNVVQSVDRMLSYFPPEARAQAQADLAVTLVGIMSMRLLPMAAGRGRAPATEILKATPTVRRILAEGAFGELYDIMKRSGDEGMMTLNQSLVRLARAGLVDEDAARGHAPNREEFRLNMQGLVTGIDSIDLRTENLEARDGRARRPQEEQND